KESRTHPREDRQSESRGSTLSGNRCRRRLQRKQIAVHAHRATSFVGMAARQRERRRSNSLWSRRFSGNTGPRHLQKDREELRASIVGSLVAAPRRIPASYSACENLEAQLDSPDKSSASPSRCVVDLGS